MTEPARLEYRADGYARWRSWDPVEKRERYVYVHQLLAVATGEDPEDVFSNGRYQVHHRDGLKWHNVQENVQLKLDEEHARDHDHLGTCSAAGPGEDLGVVRPPESAPAKGVEGR